jgi:hypothetical protein
MSISSSHKTQTAFFAMTTICFFLTTVSHQFYGGKPKKYITKLFSLRDTILAMLKLWNTHLPRSFKRFNYLRYETIYWSRVFLILQPDLLLLYSLRKKASVLKSHVGQLTLRVLFLKIVLITGFQQGLFFTALCPNSSLRNKSSALKLLI